MRLATLQFTPVWGDVDASIEHAEHILYADRSRLTGLDLLVLPELAFSGEFFLSIFGLGIYIIRCP